MAEERIFETVKVAKEAIDYMKAAFEKGDDGLALSLTGDLLTLMGSAEKRLAADKAPLTKLSALCCKNILSSLEKIRDPGHPDKVRRIFNLEIYGLFRSMDFLLCRQQEFMDSNGRVSDLQAYREERIIALEGARDEILSLKSYRYKASLCVTAFNKLEYTKLAIESLYRNTDFSAGNIELITINNGSSDGTEEYFESLPNEKKINYKYNMLGVPLWPEIFEGKYVVMVSNDVIATPGWLENLLACMDSDPNIAMASPTCNEDAIACDQGISIPYENSPSELAGIEPFAREYNKSDPALWEDRTILMPFVSIMHRAVASVIPTDPIYTKSFFVDDDLSTVFRRGGWRQVLAKDTFMHHFGSVTLGKGDKNPESAKNMWDMRRTYLDKWGVDAWESRGTLPTRKFLKEGLKPKEGIAILFFEPKFGDSFLMLKNVIRKAGVSDIRTTAVVVDDRYILDATPFFDEVIAASGIEDSFECIEGQFDAILMGDYLENLVRGDAMEAIERLHALLTPGGSLFFNIFNCGSSYALIERIRKGGPYRYGSEFFPFHGMNVPDFLRELFKRERFPHFTVKPIEYEEDSDVNSYGENLLKDVKDVEIPAEWRTNLLRARELFFEIRNWQKIT